MKALTILSFYHGLAAMLWLPQKQGKEYKYIENTKKFNFQLYISTIYF